MRIVPVARTYSTGIYNSKILRAQAEKHTNSNIQNTAHQYTGVPSYDLAYASMYDSQIAKELKLMGLI